MESSAFKLFGKTIQPAETAPTTSPESSEEEDASTAVAVVDKATSTAVGRAGKAGLSCPRCKSKETKFCYFNNYNVNQPRHFCKACHRYWTAGGTLRNVPIGAGRRKNQAQPTARPAGISTKEEEEVERWMHASLTNPPPLRPAVDL